MSGIMKKALDIFMKLVYFGLQYGYIIAYWKIRFLKVQLKKWKKCGARKKMDKVFTDLGSEIYALHVRQEGDWQNMPSVQQQLKRVAEAESQVIGVDEAIEGINTAYSIKKEEIKEKYAAKRAALSEISS